MGISFYTQRDDVMCQTVSQPLLSWHVSAAHITPSSAPPGRHPRTLPPSTTHSPPTTYSLARIKQGCGSLTLAPIVDGLGEPLTTHRREARPSACRLLTREARSRSYPRGRLVGPDAVGP